MTDQPLDPMQIAEPQPRRINPVFGLLLLAPALLCCIGTLLLPTLSTALMSLQNVRLLDRGAATWVGLANYGRLFQTGQFGPALRFTLLLVVARVLVVAILPPLLGVSVAMFGRAVRLPIRLLFTVPLALFAPAATAVTWWLALAPQRGLLSSPAAAPRTLLAVDALITFGIACGVGLVAYGMAARDGRQAPLRAVLTTWAVMLLATVALTLQTFTLPRLLTGGGPANSTLTLAALQYIQGFQTFNFGVGSALAALLLVAVGALGLIAGLLVILSGARIELAPGDGAVSRSSRGQLAIPVLALALLASVGLCALGGLPVIGGGLTSLKSARETLAPGAPLFPATPSLDAYRRAAQTLPFTRTLLNTVLPPMLAVAIQIAVAYLGALGIGALRPLGRRSEWLLLPFSPWLFVTVIPLSLSLFQSRMSMGMLNTLLGLIPPILCSVPMLFILTLFFKGQERRWQAEGDFFRTVILPSLPLAALLAFAALLIQMQALYWPLLVSSQPGNMPFGVALMLLLQGFNAQLPALAAAIVSFGLPIFAVFFLVFGVFQLFFVDRLALTTQRES